MDIIQSYSKEKQVAHLFSAAILVMLLEQLPFGGIITYPFLILTTWFHEMGHGLAAELVGGDFIKLQIESNGSGTAYHRGAYGRFESAFIAIAGPIAPSAVGALLILASAKRVLWRPTLYFMAAAIIISLVLWVRSTVGIVVLSFDALVLVYIAIKGDDDTLRFSIQFLGVMSAMSMFGHWDYFFSEGGGYGRSDTGHIEDYLWLPHWFWAIVIVAINFLMIYAALKVALSADGRANASLLSTRRRLR